MHLPPSKHASKFGVIKLHFRKRTRTLTYEQKGGWQSRADVNGISLDAHIHALYGLVLQQRREKHPHDRVRRRHSRYHAGSSREAGIAC